MSAYRSPSSSSSKTRKPRIGVGASDSTSPTVGNPVPAEINLAEARLAYVAVTRARQRLDLGGLSWIEDHPKNPPQFRRHGHGRPHAEDFGGEAPSGGSVSPWDALGPPPDEQRH